MTVTRDTPWRHLGAVPYTIWRKRILDAGGLPEAAEREVWAALGDDSALALAMLGAESSYASDFDAIPASRNNPWNLQIAGVGLSFDSIREGALAWRARLYDPAYKQGIYARTQSIADLIAVYAPKSDGNDTEGYIRTVVAEIERNGLVAAGDPPVTAPGTGEEQVSYTYDNGKAPPVKDYPVAEGKKFAGRIDPANHFIAGVVIHSAYGSLHGSTQWFQGGNALTDYMIGNSYDGPQLDGEIRRYNDPYGPRYAWASGPVNQPIDDAAKFLEIFGPNPEVINMYTTAIERSCAANVATNAVTEKEHRARCQIIAWHANIYGKRIKQRTGRDGLTCDTFPIVTTENNRSFLIYHGEISAGKRNTCPDPLVRQTLDRIIADVRAILAEWQKDGTPAPAPTPAYAPPIRVAALEAYKDADAAPPFVVSGKDTFVFVNDRVRAKVRTPRYQTANTDGLRIGPDIEPGTEFAVLWLFWDEKGVPWYITPYWTRVRVEDTQRIADVA